MRSVFMRYPGGRAKALTFSHEAYPPPQNPIDIILLFRYNIIIKSYYTLGGK